MNVTVEANVSDVTAAAAANASTSEVESAAAGYDSMRNLERIVSITGITCTLSLIWVSEWSSIVLVQ